MNGSRRMDIYARQHCFVLCGLVEAHVLGGKRQLNALRFRRAMVGVMNGRVLRQGS